MNHLGFYLLVIGIFLIYTLIYFLTKKKLAIKEDKLIYKHINKAHRNIEFAFIGIGIIGVFFYFYFFRMEAHEFLIVLFLLFLIRAMIEFIFDRESKTYVLSILSFMFTAILFIIAEIFLV